MAPGHVVLKLLGASRHALQTEGMEERRNSTIAETLGGPAGVAEATLPAVSFVTAYTATESTEISAGIAVGLVAVLTVVRLVRGESPRQSVAGVAGVILAAFVATRSGRAEDFFLPGLLANAAYATAFLISIAVRRPLVGVILGHLGDEDRNWRDDPERLRAFRQATWVWVMLFLTRLTVQLPLYLAGSVVALGVARTTLGLPLFAVGVWLTWLLVRRPPSERASVLD